ncbi:penicillin-binding protein 2 [Planomonospora parontospora]|uniref:penicillin-binding protein 2 n=1 Tax=Planomonospora parontospora TaxID=58119 RepID=UPI0016704018|nr:penicillin-binding protein 2 [Planomonospora parontospora]GGL17788.1 penicillin-binding protein 2 [Planomonospora parontospora subsp. antibiotica]GII15641.1 penicillin-binding protein 2 [Planomonospora parontospora subsp. antibiotica]
MIHMRRRLAVVQVLLVVLLVVVTARLWQVQVVRGAQYAAAATETRTRDVVVPAVRGQILDSAGRPLVRNRTTLVVSVDRTKLGRMKDKGAAVMARLGSVLGRDPQDLTLRLRPCDARVSRPCWAGSPHQPIPVDADVDTPEALQILERQEMFPGVTTEVQAVRDHPGGGAAVQALGYLQPVTKEELERRQGLKAEFSGVDMAGRDGLESVYDQELRGTPGWRRVQVDRLGRVLGVEHEVQGKAGHTLITSIDARVQAVAERAIAEAMKAAPKADGAAAVVLDARTSRVIALASAPSYDPAVWAGGIGEEEYERLLSGKSGKPLVSRAIKGEFAPGSTFKMSSVAAMFKAGYPMNGHYNCPGSFMVGSRAFRNFRGRALGSMTLHTALVKSCDTIFYKAAYEQWLKDGGLRPKGKPREVMAKTARAFGFGRPTGVDLPGESPGRIPDRAWKKKMWAATRDVNCRRAKEGYQDVAKTDAGRAAFLTRLAHENCLEGYQLRPGDAANFSIGQGDVLVTPLQLAAAYAALVTDGKLRSPRLGWMLVRPDGTRVKEIKAPVRGTLPVSATERAYIKRALSQVASDGTAAGAFTGFPMKKVRIGGKTGTAEVYGKADTSWFASFAPVEDPRFVVVAMVSQGGLGSAAAAPAVRKIYEGIYGFTPKGKPAPAALPGGAPAARPPVIKQDGTLAW